jgi:general secretion pathway protein K
MSASRPTIASRQRGVALIMAVLIVALATMLAVSVGFKSYLDQRRSATTFALEQGLQYAYGGEALAGFVLQKDIQQNSKTDDFTEEWAQPTPPFPVDGGEIQGAIEDMQGRFNLNNLVKQTIDGSYVADPEAIDRFKKLLGILQVDQKWADAIADWIDSDSNPTIPDGAEDTVYTGLDPPYLTANRPITRVSELLALKGFGLENYQKVEPFVSALRVGTAINLCTAPGAVLDSILPQGVMQFSTDLEGLAKQRQQGCFPTLQQFQPSVNNQQLFEKLQTGQVIAEKSSYFRATVFVTLGTTQFTLYSLLYRESTGQVRPIQRSFGST